MDAWTAYFLGVVSTLVVLAAAWLVLRVLEPWLMARVSDVPIGFSHVLGMRLRKTDARVVVGTLIVLTKLGEPMSALELEAIYLSLPEGQRTGHDLLRAARPDLTASAM